MTKETRLRIVTKLLNNGVEDRETRHRLYKEQNALRCEIQKEITRWMDAEILEGLNQGAAI